MKAWTFFLTLKRIHNGQKKLVPCGLLAGYRLLNLEQVKQCYFKELRGIPIYFVRIVQSSNFSRDNLDFHLVCVLTNKGKL